MKKTVTISLARYAFTIEEEAFVKLSSYLTALKKTLSEKEAEEVIYDIELRMVELLNENLKNRNVVSIEDVDLLIAHIGTPEEMEDFENKKTSFSHEQTLPDKQLFRDTERKKIAGVCSGLAYYFGIDVVLVRIIFLLLFFGTGFGFILYLILWIIVPKAETTGDILKMKGKPVNFENIKDYSSQMAREAYDSANSFYSTNKPRIRTAIQRIVHVIGRIIGVFAAIIAFCFLLLSFAYLFGKITWGDASFSIPQNIHFYLGSGTFSKAIIFIGFSSLFLTAVYFIMLAVRCFYTPFKAVILRTTFWLALTAWIFWCILFIVGITKIDKQYRGNNEHVETTLIPTASDTLFLSVKNNVIPAGFEYYLGDIYSDGKTIYENIHTKLNVIQEDSLKTPFLKVEKTGEGEHIPLDIQLPLEIVGNKLIFPDKYSFQYKNRFRSYHVKYTLHLPGYMMLIKEKNAEISVLYKEKYDETEWSNEGIKEIHINNKAFENDSAFVNGKKVPLKDIKFTRSQIVHLLED